MNETSADEPTLAQLTELDKTRVLARVPGLPPQAPPDPETKTGQFNSYI